MERSSRNRALQHLYGFGKKTCNLNQQWHYGSTIVEVIRMALLPFRFSAVTLSLCLLSSSASAFPGQSTAEAKAWIKGHPTLRPAPSETLIVRKSDTPARRFIFQATPLQVGRVSTEIRSQQIRTEEISLFDMTHGVSRARLEESLRIIYGSSLYQDYQSATVLYKYPKSPVSDTNQILEGEVREGDRYAYWLERPIRPDGTAYTGRIVVFLRDDLPKLKTELLQR